MTRFKTALTLVAAAGLALGSVTAQARDFRLGLITPPAHIWTQAATDFAQELRDQSHGQHRVSVFPSQQLGNEAQMVQQLQTGALDMAFLTIAEISNRVPDFGALYAPYLVEDIDQAAALLQSDAASRLLDQLPGSVGVVGIGYGMAGMRQVLSRSAVEGPGDLKGKKLRITPFEPIRDFYTALGSAPTPLPLPGVYDALANGQVDAIDMDFDSILVLKFYERANHLLLSNHMMFPMVGVVSGRVWRELGNDDKALIQTLMKAQLDKVIEQFRQQERDQEQQLRDLNIQIVEADRATFADAIQRWEATWSSKAKALDGLRRAAQDIKGS
ncbi:C4-dicarboxylate ABC transporter substrate-binding protein [Zobellella denitrificans]|uniref:C4-dicarboxylate ABC transporter substrate-binding protein n=1 Tax=Zobellella denitrificans TaxID=347534 RepID=A0A291HS36_9GAMM|nr:TRAP transporter substrate-binding protein [Zobellella denitrificans]ATG74934.1 C4-dicarboxylate ABC transporter substrate-binding protein [Zobellella denitrificans]